MYARDEYFYLQDNYYTVNYLFDMLKFMPYYIRWLDQAHQREDIQPIAHRG